MVHIYINYNNVEWIYQYTSYYYTHLYTYIPSDNTIPDTSISQRNRNFKNTPTLHDLSGSPTAAKRQPSDPHPHRR